MGEPWETPTAPGLVLVWHTPTAVTVYDLLDEAIEEAWWINQATDTIVTEVELAWPDGRRVTFNPRHHPIWQGIDAANSDEHDERSREPWWTVEVRGVTAAGFTSQQQAVDTAEEWRKVLGPEVVWRRTR